MSGLRIFAPRDFFLAPNQEKCVIIPRFCQKTWLVCVTTQCDTTDKYVFLTFPSLQPKVMDLSCLRIWWT